MEGYLIPTHEPQYAHYICLRETLQVYGNLHSLAIKLFCYRQCLLLFHLALANTILEEPRNEGQSLCLSGTEPNKNKILENDQEILVHHYFPYLMVPSR